MIKLIIQSDLFKKALLLLVIFLIAFKLGRNTKHSDIVYRTRIVNNKEFTNLIKPPSIIERVITKKQRVIIHKIDTIRDTVFVIKTSKNGLKGIYKNNYFSTRLYPFIPYTIRIQDTNINIRQSLLAYYLYAGFSYYPLTKSIIPCLSLDIHFNHFLFSTKLSNNINLSLFYLIK